MNANDKSTAPRKAIKWSRLMVIVAFLLGTFGAANAQSNDRENPKPLSSNLIKGAGAGKKVEYYYSFTGGPGQIVLTIDLKAKAAATNADVEVFDPAGTKIFYYYPNATTTNERAQKHFTISGKQTLTRRLALDSSAGDYAIRLGGAVDLTVAQPSTAPGSQLSEGNMTQLPPAFPQPDLIVKDITFGDQTAPGNVRAEVANQGDAASSECWLAFTSSKPMPAGQTEQRTWSVKVPAIAAGKGAFLRFSVAPLTQTDGPWQAFVDRSNTVKESNETNNTFTYAPTKPGTAPASLPDLLIESFELVDPEKGQVNIVVVNKGSSGYANAAPCMLRLIVWEPGQFEKKEAKTVFVKVPPLHTGVKATVIAIAGVPIINTKYSMFVDIDHDVKELNENNNRAEGEAGNYKP